MDMAADEYMLFEPDYEYMFDPVNPIQLACCDCGLVHMLYFKINKDGTLTFRLEVNEEETERLRENPQIKEGVFGNHKNKKMRGK